ncbi:hypothetical protein GALL_525500 [mine drainage metagenome]|uniref:Uncharacterized protein n=1 Tax=mine drainage metagenome TaxID=410659 RepID=A0A1J5P3Y3_9ZZZZ
MDHVHQKLGQLIDPSGQVQRLGIQGRVIGKQMRIVFADHAATGTRRNHHRPGLDKQVELLQGHGARLIGKTTAVSGLTAAGLLLQIVHGDALTLQQLHRIQPGFGLELVNQASGKKINIARLGRIAPHSLGRVHHVNCLLFYQLVNWYYQLTEL